jgi:hypothetical protein
MKGESFLLTIAQIALALAGFAGIIGAFRQAEREWKPQEIAGLQLMLEHTFAAVLFALLPFPLFFVLSLQIKVWSIASSLLAGFLILEFIIQRRRIILLSVRGAAPRRSSGLKYFFFPPTAIFAVIQVVNAYWWHSLSGYSWGLLWLLVAPSIQFFHFVLHL